MDLDVDMQDAAVKKLRGCGGVFEPCEEMKSRMHKDGMNTDGKTSELVAVGWERTRLNIPLHHLTISHEWQYSGQVLLNDR